MTISPATSAIDIISGHRERRFTVTETARAFLRHIERYDDRIQAFVTINAEQVLEDAAWLDQSADRGRFFPLHGLPVGIKDIIDVAGLPTIAGFEPYRASVAERDAAIVAALRGLGALILGKTHTTQFAVGDPAPTRNPWNLEKSPAGSSAGSGAAVAAAMAPITLGSQTAGSMLRPAAFNGVVGFKPSYGWCSMQGVLPLCWSLDSLGLYAASVDDVLLVCLALTGSEPSTTPREAGNLRVALLREFLEMSDENVSAHVRDVACALEEAGATVIEIAMPVNFDLVFAVHQTIFAAEMAAVHSSNLDQFRSSYGPRIATAVDSGRLIPGSDLIHAQRLRRQVQREFEALMEQWDALLLPTVSTEACDIDETGDRRFQIPATLLGSPAISLPTGLSENRLPLGTQLIGRRGDDLALLSTAQFVSDHLPTIGRPDLDTLF